LNSGLFGLMRDSIRSMLILGLSVAVNGPRQGRYASAWHDSKTLPTLSNGQDVLSSDVGD
jgi:hypothetical protein